nr:unnamed protein product [Spirometra erinaceieuropaei]
MGSPVSGFIAEAVLQRLESLVFQHHRPKFWARCVDDTFVVIEQDQVLTFKEHLNAVFPDIQFTMEEEENNQLAFLDVLVCRKHCGRLKTSVQESDKYDASTELQQQTPNQPQTQLSSAATCLLKLMIKAPLTYKSCVNTRSPRFHEVNEQVRGDEIVPDYLLSGIFVPIFKKGDKMNCENNCEIGFINVAAKVFVVVLLQEIPGCA